MIDNRSPASELGQAAAAASALVWIRSDSAIARSARSAAANSVSAPSAPSRPCSHRASASTPTIAPVAIITCGWNRNSISSRSSAWRRSIASFSTGIVSAPLLPARRIVALSDALASASASLARRNRLPASSSRSATAMPIRAPITTGASTTRVPGLGDLPILGPAFSFNTISTIETEMIILVTPELVAPLERHEVTEAPGDRVNQPSDAEFYFLGRIEGKLGTEFRATKAEQDPLNLMKHFQSERDWVIGPHGYAD